MTARPWFPFYVADWTLGTQAMSLEEKGAYLTLLVYQWDHGHIPLEPEKLERILGLGGDAFEELWPTLAEKFPAHDQANGHPNGRNVRLAQVYSDSLAHTEALSKAGRAGAAKRWGGSSQANSPANGQAIARRQSQSQTEEKKNPPTPHRRTQSWEGVLERPEYEPLRRSATFMVAWLEWIEWAQTSGTAPKIPKGAQVARMFNQALKDPNAYVNGIDAAIQSNWKGIHPKDGDTQASYGRSRKRSCIDLYNEKYGGKS